MAATAHQNGSVKSATSPKPAKVSQNIFFCMFPAYFESRPIPFGVRNRKLSSCKKQKKRDAMSIAPRFFNRHRHPSRFLVYGSRRIRRF